MRQKEFQKLRKTSVRNHAFNFAERGFFMAKICIIVGHGKSKSGGYDSGAVSKDGKAHEFKIAREIARYAAAEIRAAGLECDLMNYEGDLYLTERIKTVNKKDYNFIAEIHLNAGGGTGTEVYYYHDSPTGKKYAQAISKEIAAAFSVRNRGAKIRIGNNGKDYFGIIRDTKPCAVLVETLFIDTESDLKKINTAAGQYKCGEAIAKAIVELNGKKLDNAANSGSSGSTPKLTAGAAIKLNNSPVYASSTAKAVKSTKTGTFYIYDGVDFSGRLRITSKKENCGKKPAALYVTGYINKSEM